MLKWLFWVQMCCCVGLTLSSLFWFFAPERFSESWWILLVVWSVFGLGAIAGAIKDVVLWERLGRRYNRLP